MGRTEPKPSNFHFHSKDGKSMGTDYERMTSSGVLVFFGGLVRESRSLKVEKERKYEESLESKEFAATGLNF
jgi:hypothetical protein